MKIARWTGWPLEYIDQLGLQDRIDILEVEDVESAIKRDFERKAAQDQRNKRRRAAKRRRGR